MLMGLYSPNYSQVKSYIIVPFLYSQEIQKKRKDIQNQPQTIKKMAIGTYISIITLNVNRLNALTKRCKLAEWIQKQDSYIYVVFKKPTLDLKTGVD